MNRLSNSDRGDPGLPNRKEPIMTTDPNIYFAKATSHGNPWRSAWSNLETAKKAAAQFVADWKDIGVNVESAVFYRDGSIVEHFGALPCITK